MITTVIMRFSEKNVVSISFSCAYISSISLLNYRFFYGKKCYLDVLAYRRICEINHPERIKTLFAVVIAFESDQIYYAFCHK